MRPEGGYGNCRPARSTPARPRQQLRGGNWPRKRELPRPTGRGRPSVQCPVPPACSPRSFSCTPPAACAAARPGARCTGWRATRRCAGAIDGTITDAETIVGLGRAASLGAGWPAHFAAIGISGRSGIAKGRSGRCGKRAPAEAATRPTRCRRLRGYRTHW